MFALFLMFMGEDFTLLGLLDGLRPVLMQTWYIKSLMIFVVISPILVWLIRRAPISVIALASFFCLTAKFVMSDPYWKSFWEYTFSLSGLIYFLIGLSLSCNKESDYSIAVRTEQIIGFIGFALGLVGMLIKVYGSGYGELVARGIKLISTPLLLLGVWSVIPCDEWPNRMLSMTFPLYILHMFAIKGCNRVFAMFGIEYAQSIGLTVLVFIFVVTISFLLALVIRCAMPCYGQILWGRR